MRQIHKEIEEFMMTISDLWEEKPLTKEEVDTIIDLVREELELVNPTEDV